MIDKIAWGAEFSGVLNLMVSLNAQEREASFNDIPVARMWCQYMALKLRQRQLSPSGLRTKEYALLDILLLPL